MLLLSLLLLLRIECFRRCVCSCCCCCSCFGCCCCCCGSFCCSASSSCGCCCCYSSYCSSSGCFWYCRYLSVFFLLLLLRTVVAQVLGCEPIDIMFLICALCVFFCYTTLCASDILRWTHSSASSSGLWAVGQREHPSLFCPFLLNNIDFLFEWVHDYFLTPMHIAHKSLKQKTHTEHISKT